MKIRMRQVTDAEVAQAQRDGKKLIRLNAPGWESEPFFNGWGVLEQWNEYKGTYEEIEIVVD